MTISTIAWVVIGLLLALFCPLLVETFSLLALGPLAVWAAAGVLLLGASLWHARKPERRRGTAATILLVVTVALLFVPVVLVSSRATTRIRFRWQRAAYDRVVAKLQDLRPSTLPQSGEGLTFVVDAGPPRRIAFPWPGGILDNWCGAVYDPTGEVMQSSKFNGDWSTWRDQVPPEVIDLFGGDLVWCRDLNRPYFFCCFT